MAPKNYETRCFECEKVIDPSIYKAKMTVGIITDTSDHVWIHFHISCFGGLAGDEWFVMLKTKWENRHSIKFEEKHPENPIIEVWNEFVR